MATSAHSGMSRPSRKRLMPTSASNAPRRKVADDLDALHGVDVGVHVADADALLVQVFGQVLGHPLGQHGDQRAVAWRAVSRTSPTRSSTWVRAGRISTGGSIKPGRADHLLGEHAAGFVQFPRAGRGRDADGLRPHGVPFLEAERPVGPCRMAAGNRIRRAWPCAGSRRGTCADLRHW